MKMRKKTPLLHIIPLAFMFLLSSLHALTITKTYSAPTVSIDGVGDYGTSLPPVSFLSTDFPLGATISKVTTSITWRKTDGTCASPASGWAYHDETSFRLDGPVGSTILATSGTWSGGTDTGDVRTVFDQSATSTPSSTPVTGTFQPNGGNLNTLNGLNPVGDWNLAAGDNANIDPLCVHSYAVSITVLNDNDGDGVDDEIDLDDDNDGILDTVESSLPSFSELNTTIGTIPDNGGATTCLDRTFMVTDSQTISKAIITVDIDHTGRGDLSLDLISPSNTSVSLMNRQGGWKNNVYVIFDDAATVSIVGDNTNFSRPPVERSPEVFLANFNGENTLGIWTLHMCDYRSWQTGTFHEGNLTFYYGSDDFDGDGVINAFDLDSDNDGIADNVEAQGVGNHIYSTQPPTFRTSNPGIGTNDQYPTTGIVPNDQDGDGRPDYLDTDSDNDGISDCEEGMLDPGGKTCIINSTNVGKNGLVGWAENPLQVDNYKDVDGVVEGSIANALIDYNTGVPMAYREVSFCGNIMRWSLKQNQWKTISAPCSVNNDITALFGSLGVYGDTGDWVMYKQGTDYSGTPGSMIAMLSTETMEPGKGYWIITSNPDVIIEQNEYQLTVAPSKATVSSPVNHSEIRGSFSSVFNLPSISSDPALKHKFLLGVPFSMTVHTGNFFVSINNGTNYYPLDDTINIGSNADKIIYVYNPTVTGNYIAKDPSTPGFGDTIEPGVGFWMADKNVSGSSFAVDFPEEKVK